MTSHTNQFILARRLSALLIADQRSTGFSETGQNDPSRATAVVSGRLGAAVRPPSDPLDDGSRAPGTLREFDQALDDGGRPGASSEGKRAPSGRRALVGLESEPMDALGRAGRIERLTIQPPAKTHECYSRGNRRPAK